MLIVKFSYRSANRGLGKINCKKWIISGKVILLIQASQLLEDFYY